MIEAMSKKKVCCPDNVITSEHVWISVAVIVALGLLYGIGCVVYYEGVSAGIDKVNRCREDGKIYSVRNDRCF